ncbi:hypothetical protein F0L68_13245 [Solihabitans fulvus]|uniref:Tetratricopeptide repeat protein n=1 Tax=Solihabitans fulvus TaxID=1892852 RepID=A0A5B2XEM6_9PSEU|nr:hypothetical protein [Solihabitans fulvus]KAA2262248.1 hypothetical protein F0L68_13245 [Solihabitans fulvus]
MSGNLTSWADTPFEHHLDPETLREVPHRPEELASWLDARLAAPAPADAEAELVWRTEVGVAARLLGRLDLAERELTVALTLAERSATADPLAARVRLALVHQWQGRFELARSELVDCLVRVARRPKPGPVDPFIEQHAGTCAYDAGDWPLARHHFGRAVRLRADEGGRAAAAAALLAVDAADACATAADLAAEVDRLVIGVHRATAGSGVFREVERPPHAGVLIDVAELLLAGPVSVTVLRGVHRYADGLDATLAELVDGGWLEPIGDAVATTARCVPALEAIVAGQHAAAAGLWPDPEAALNAVRRVVAGATGGPVFAAFAGHSGEGGQGGEGGEGRHGTEGSRLAEGGHTGAAGHHDTDGHAGQDSRLAEGGHTNAASHHDTDRHTGQNSRLTEGQHTSAAGHHNTGDHAGQDSHAGRLFGLLVALRQHRAEAHAAAWAGEGLTAAGVRALAEEDPVRRRVKATTGRLASRPYRPLPAPARWQLLGTLRALASD